MRKNATLILWLFLVSDADIAIGATRTMQFAGNGVSFISLIRKKLPLIRGGSIRFNNICGIVIANTGRSAVQISSLEFNVFHPASGAFERAANRYLSEIFNRGASTQTSPSCARVSPSETCLNTPIEGGGIFVAAIEVGSTTIEGKNEFVPCSGKFTVVDANPASPSSVLASGFITYLSEFGLSGGQLHGAIYWSGSHIRPGSPENSPVNSAPILFNNAEGRPTTPLPSSWESRSWAGSMQMNLYCAEACRISGVTRGGTPLSTIFCRAACGMHDVNEGVGGSGESSMSASDRNRNVLGFLEESSPTLRRIESTPGGGGGSRSCNPMEFREPLHEVSSPTIHGLLRTANPHWAGGRVTEMIVGPFTSICSGNREYYLRGGAEFTHENTIENDVGLIMAKSRSPTAGPPERLFCAHKHNQEYPFGHVSTSTQFAINGGMPF